AGRLRVQCSLTEDGLGSALEEMRERGRVFEGRKGRWYSASAIEEMKSAVVARLGKLHAMEPLKTFVPLNAVAGHVAPSPEERECFRLTLEALAKDGMVATAGEQVRLGNHTPQWGEREGAARDRILRRCLESGLAVPSPAELAADAGLGEQECGVVIDALVNAGELEVLAKGIYVHPTAIAECRTRVQRYLKQHGTMTVGECRELLGASRKYLLPFLEQLDREGVTVRQENHRVLAGRGQAGGRRGQTGGGRWR
ncbi:MAG: SelB C-terminal domain-containing protein, partial [Armatimonadetes bacterium]|nr:SelB C-terminal domain-containing protein [Armatimonadota bacterium]